jgi:hypothetical protein
MRKGVTFFCVFSLSLFVISCERDNVIKPPPHFNISYTKLGPDTLVYWKDSCYYLDLDKDGLMDIVFTSTPKTCTYGSSTFQNWMAQASIVNPDLSMSVGDQRSYSGSVYVMGSVIDSSTYHSWRTGELFCNGCNAGGCWYASHTFEGYLAFRIMKGGSPYYGWMKLQSDGPPSWYNFILKEYAMDNNSNPYLLIGQKH